MCGKRGYINHSKLNLYHDYDITLPGISAYSYGPADILRTSSVFLNNNNLVDSKEFQFGAFDPQIHSSNFRPISSENPSATNTHLLDHNYAASAYDECFGDSWRGKNKSLFVISSNIS